MTFIARLLLTFGKFALAALIIVAVIVALIYLLRGIVWVLDQVLTDQMVWLREQLSRLPLPKRRARRLTRRDY